MPQSQPLFLSEAQVQAQMQPNLQEMAQAHLDPEGNQFFTPNGTGVTARRLTPDSHHRRQMSINGDTIQSNAEEVAACCRGSSFPDSSGDPSPTFMSSSETGFEPASRSPATCPTSRASRFVGDSAQIVPDQCSNLHGRSRGQQNHQAQSQSCHHAEDEQSGRASSEGRRRRRVGKKAHRVHGEALYPHAWEWRRPADDDVIIPDGAWIYLALIGWLSFAVAWFVNACSGFLAHTFTPAVTDLAVRICGKGVEFTVLVIVRALFLVTAFITVSRLSPRYSAGSGIPEMKCVLSGVFMPHALSGATLVAKSVGLTFALASSVSIGCLGPFIHISGICAALVSRIKWFSSLSSSARFQLQAVSCAMAAGVGATFGAPIGGTMLSIELMSTYYYIHWLPMALYCSIMGYHLAITFTPIDAKSYFETTVAPSSISNQNIAKVLTYAVLGACCGLVGAALVQYTVAMFKLRRRVMANATTFLICCFLVAFVGLHSTVTAQFGGVLDESQRSGVLWLFNRKYTDSISDQWMINPLFLFASDRLNSASQLLAITLVKFLLTGVCLVLPVPAGTFMPIFEIGALFGRAFGELCNLLPFLTFIDPRATAIVGAASLASGTLHTTSIAIVMLEITGESLDIMPLAVGVIVAYGVSKHICSDLFSELIKIRRLPFVLGLRERYPQENKDFFERVSLVSAGTFMTKEFPFVTPDTTTSEVRCMLARNPSALAWGSCAFFNNSTDRRLWGTIPRAVLANAVSYTQTDAAGSSLPVSQSPVASGAVGEHETAPLHAVVSSSSLDSQQQHPRQHDQCHRHQQQEQQQEQQQHQQQAAYGTFLAHNRGKEEVLDEKVALLREYDPAIGHRNVDEGPFVVSSQAPFWKVATYFRMLGLGSMYVIQDGRTVGLVTKAQVIQYAFSMEDEAKVEREEKKQREREVADLVAMTRKSASGSAGLTGRGSSSRMASRFSQQDLVQMATPAHRRNRGGGRD
jgi:H+/Cl- antiporter ClcA/CBS domain-containing protein